MHTFKAGLEIPPGDPTKVINKNRDVLTFVSFSANSWPEYNNYGEAKAWIDFLSAKFGRVQIVIADTLQWRNVFMDRVLKEQADSPRELSSIDISHINFDGISAIINEKGEANFDVLFQRYSVIDTFVSDIGSLIIENENKTLGQECIEHSQGVAAQWQSIMSSMLDRKNIFVTKWDAPLVPPLGRADTKDRLVPDLNAAKEFILAELCKPDPSSEKTETLRKAFIATIKDRVKQTKLRYTKQLNPKTNSNIPEKLQLITLLNIDYLLEEAVDLYFRGVHMASNSIVYAYPTPLNRVLNYLVVHSIITKDAGGTPKPKMNFHKIILKQEELQAYFDDNDSPPPKRTTSPMEIKGSGATKSNPSSKNNSPPSSVSSKDSMMSVEHKRIKHEGKSGDEHDSSSDEFSPDELVSMKNATPKIKNYLGGILGLFIGDLNVFDIDQSTEKNSLTEFRGALKNFIAMTEGKEVKRFYFNEITLNYAKHYFTNEDGKKNNTAVESHKELIINFNDNMTKIRKIFNKFGQNYPNLQPEEKNRFDELNATFNSLSEFHRKLEDRFLTMLKELSPQSSPTLKPRASYSRVLNYLTTADGSSNKDSSGTIVKVEDLDDSGNDAEMGDVAEEESTAMEVVAEGNAATSSKKNTDRSNGKNHVGSATQAVTLGFRQQQPQPHHLRSQSYTPGKSPSYHG